MKYFSEKIFFNQNIYFENLHENILIDVKNKIKQEFEEMDYQIKSSKERENAGWIIKDYRKRTIKTIYGNVNFIRTRYRNKWTKEVKTLVDQHIPIEKYQRMIPHLKIEILNRVGEGNRYRDIVDALRDSGISEQTISNTIKKFNISNETLNELECPKIDVIDKPFIYLETDDTFPNLIKNNKKTSFRIRLLVAHTGVVKGIHNRNFLQNKRIDYKFLQLGTTISTVQFSKEIKQLLHKWYENVENKQLILMGDAANWIPNLADELGAKYVLDKYHLIKELARIFPNRSRYKNPRIIFYKMCFYKIREKIIYGNSYEEILNICNDIFLNLEENNWFDKLEDFKSFISFVKRNKRSIQNYYKEFDSSSHTEGQISSFVKSTLGYGKKIYSYKIFNNLLKIKKLKTNGYDFSELLEFDLETLQLKNISYNFQEIKEFTKFGNLNKDKKSDLNLNGQWARKYQSGFKHNSK